MRYFFSTGTGTPPRPDGVLIDLDLPDIHGTDVCRKLRATLPRATLLVAVTGFGHPAARQRSLEAGFDAHIVKPGDPSYLATILATAGRQGAAGTKSS